MVVLPHPQSSRTISSSQILKLTTSAKSPLSQRVTGVRGRTSSGCHHSSYHTLPQSFRCLRTAAGWGRGSPPLPLSIKWGSLKPCLSTPCPLSGVQLPGVQAGGYWREHRVNSPRVGWTTSPVHLPGFTFQSSNSSRFYSCICWSDFSPSYPDLESRPHCLTKVCGIVVPCQHVHVREWRSVIEILLAVRTGSVS